MATYCNGIEWHAAVGRTEQAYPAMMSWAMGPDVEERMEHSELLSRVTIDPEVCNGRPTLRGKRITAQTILEFLSAGESREEILRQYPSLKSEDIDACLAFAAWLLGRSYVVKMTA